MTTLLHTHEITVSIGNKTICDNLNLSVRAGEIWGILGPNGCGKTTLLHALAGLLPAQGEIHLNGKNLQQLSAKLLAQTRGILFQHFTETFPQTVWEYCSAARFPHLPYFKTETIHDKQIILTALQKMDLENFHHKTIDKLSGGEKRRLAITALLAQTPLIYFLDEPSNHLDIRHQILVLTHLQQLAQTEKVSVIMTLHDINLAQQFCQHILLLFNDGTSMQGRTEDILTTANLTRLYQHPLVAIPHGRKLFWQPEALALLKDNGTI